MVVVSECVCREGGREGGREGERERDLFVAGPPVSLICLKCCASLSLPWSHVDSTWAAGAHCAPFRHSGPSRVARWAAVCALLAKMEEEEEEEGQKENFEVIEVNPGSAFRSASCSRPSNSQNLLVKLSLLRSRSTVPRQNPISQCFLAKIGLLDPKSLLA